MFVVLLMSHCCCIGLWIDKQNKDSKIAVFDLGGGTFDISVLELADGVLK